MGKGGRPLKVHEDLSQLKRLVEKNELISIQSLIESHGIDAYDEYKRTALIYSAFFEQLGTLNWLIEKGADLDFQDRIGFTSLHFCAQEKNAKAAAVLLDKGANPNVQDEHGNTALWTALFNAKGDFEIVKMLRSYGTDPTHKNVHGRSPNDMAITMYKKTIDELIDSKK